MKNNLNLLLLLLCYLINNILCDNYGVDVSFPIHHKIDPKSYQGKRYTEFIDGCSKAFTRRECEATEEARFKMSREQPATQFNYTELGFKKTRTPENIFTMLKDFYESNKENKHVEQWGRAYTYTNNWVSPTYMISVEDTGLRGAGSLLKAKIWEGIRPIIEEWTGHKLKPTSLYGIREYTTGAILSTHVDRIPLVSSCIINVAQDLDEPWPLEVYDHDGKAHNVTMEPGDLVLYESHTVLHGRPFPLKGKYFANIFVHFEPVDHAEMNRQIHKKLVDVVRSEKINPRDYDPEAEDFSKISKHELSKKQVDDDDTLDKAEEEEEEGENEPGFEINHAAARNDLPLVKNILESNLHAIHNADANGWQPIHEAVRAGHTKMVKFLINMGADMGAKTRNGGSPLWWAKRTLPKGHPTIHYLEQIGAPEDGDEF